MSEQPTLIDRYREALANGALKPDAAQAEAARRLQMLAEALGRPRRWWRANDPPRGLYLWGDVGRGKSMLMDMFFAAAPVRKKLRVHFNAFMTDVHARIHALRIMQGDPIPEVASGIAAKARLLCFDEFQVNDVADAMILGRLFEQLFDEGVVMVATSNVAPARLYEGGINRQLFLPFIAEIERHLDVLELKEGADYRLGRDAGMRVYMTPLGPDADRTMDEAWRLMTGSATGEKMTLEVLGHELRVPEAARGVARFSFEQLCGEPLAAPDFLLLAGQFHTIFIDRIPLMGPDRRNEAKRLTVLIDTLYDQGRMVVCSAAGPPDRLYPAGDGSDAFRRTASRLVEMQSEDYLRNHAR